MSLPTESTSRANGTARSEIHRSVLEHGQLAVHVYWPGHQLRQALEGQHVVMYAGPCLPVLQQLGEELLQRGGWPRACWPASAPSARLRTLSAAARAMRP